jgi:Bifunctional DNA primase/polymerase, N-terminal
MTTAGPPRVGGSLLRAALSAAARGWHVFPCVPGGKRPALRDNWQQLATTDPARILCWWTRMPFNIGISCGPSGLVVIDLDVAKSSQRDDEFPASGADSLAKLCKRHYQTYPDNTFAVRTPSGGTHLYFRANSYSVRNSASHLGPLIDIRAAAGYVVAPGSRVTGRAYEVTDPSRPAPLPDWIASLLGDRPAPAVAHQPPASGICRPSSYALSALREETARVAAACPGTRNDTLNRAAFSLGQLVSADLLPAAAVVTALANAADRCGLPEDEAHRTIRSGMASGIRRPRVKGRGQPHRIVSPSRDRA